MQSLGGHKLELQLARGRLVISDMRKRLEQQQMRSLTGKRPAAKAPEDASAGPHKPKARRHGGGISSAFELADVLDDIPVAIELFLTLFGPCESRPSSAP